MSTATPADVSQTVLDETPGRVFDFLHGVSRFPAIQAVLRKNGYTAEQHAKGWTLLMAVSGAPNSAKAPAKTATPADQAIGALDAWDESGFARIDAALESSFPEQHALVFAGGLSASTGVAAVVGVQSLLQRLDRLEQGTDRSSEQHAKDLEALALLAQRGIDADERKRLDGLVKQAIALGPDAGTGAADPAHDQAAQALYGWYRDWAKTAHAVVSKRAHLISLGLAKRRASAPDDATPAVTTPATPTKPV